jgi:hypothetical protein
MTITRRPSGYVRIESSRRALVTAAAIVAVCALGVSYFVALAHARIEARTWRARYCAVQVDGFYARHPRLRFAQLVDSCIELERLTGKVAK